MCVRVCVQWGKRGALVLVLMFLYEGRFSGWYHTSYWLNVVAVLLLQLSVCYCTIV